MSDCPELKIELRRLVADRKTGAEWLQICRDNENAARRSAELAEQQLLAIDLQIDRIERALEECVAHGFRS